MQEFLTQVEHVRYLTLDVVELVVRLVAPEALTYQAGQAMELKVDHSYLPYSFATPPVPDNPALTFCIRTGPTGITADYARTLKPGTEVVMRGPVPGFEEPDYNQPAFFVAGSIGVAPFAAMVPDMLSRGYTQPLRLLFGVSSEEEVFYFDRFNRLAKQFENFQFVPLLSRPRSHWPGETGRISTYLQISYPYLKDFMFYVSGGRNFVNDVRQVLQQAGHDPSRIKVAIFE